jgi:phosphatidylinositol alpha-1,6-mannosyltransferase
VLLLATKAYGHGGIQVYTRRLIEILSGYAEMSQLPLYCVSLLDTHSCPEEHAHAVRYAKFEMAGGSKVRFTNFATRAAWAARPRVIIVAHTGLGPIAWLLRKTAPVGRYIVVLHGIEAWRRLRPLDRTAAAGANRIVATTRYTARAFAEHNAIDSSRFRIIPLAIPEPGVCENANPIGKSTTFQVLAVGRLVASDAYKGFDMLISATHRVRSSGAQLALYIIGSGDDLPRLQAHATSLGLDGCVRFMGSVSDRELRDALSSSHVFAMPSRAEGFGIVYLEAMRYGCPCIAGNHGGVPELIEDGIDGFLVEYGNVEQLSDRLLTLYRNSDLRLSMGHRARHKIESEYLFPRMRDDWFNLLEELVN